MGRSKSTTTNTQTLNPWSQQQFQDRSASIMNNMANNPVAAYGGQFAADLSPLQIQAMQGYDPNAGMGAVDQAMGMLGGGFDPMQVQANYGPSNIMSDYSAQQIAANYDPSVQTFADADLSAYMNPYINQVIDGTLSDLDRTRQMQIMSGQDAATGAGAFGGSRHGVADSLTNEAALRQAAATSGALRAQGFDTAAGLFGADRAAQMQAQQFGAGLDLQAQGMSQADRQFASDRAMQAQLANMQSSQFGAGLDMQGQLANQQAQQFGANLGLQGAGLLGQLGASRADMARNAAMTQAGLGSMEQDRQQRELDMQYQDFLRMYEDPFRRSGVELGLLGATPMLVNQRGTQTHSPSFLGMLGGGLSTLGGLGWNPFGGGGGSLLKGGFK